MYDEKVQRKNDAPKESINFADSLSQQDSPQGIAAPEYNPTSTYGKKEESNSYQTQGSITFYCNGFIPDRDYLGNEERGKNAANDAQGNGETMHADDTTIAKADDYWGAMDNQLEERFTGKAPNADSTFYFDGSAGPLSSAEDRMEYGKSAAAMIIRQVESGAFQLDENGVLPDVINVVGHSMGAAYAAGLAQGLLDYNAASGKKVFDVRAVYYFAPHQPMDISHPSEVRGVQYSHRNDAVTSQGDSDDPLALWGLIPKISGSTLAPIKGIHEFMVHDIPGLDQSMLGDRGGHNITDHEYTLTKYKQGRDGYISANSEEEYDSENYKHQTVSTDGYEARSVHLPNLIDKLKDLPEDMRKKIDELNAWMSGKVTGANAAFKEKVNKGKDWLDEKRQDGKDWIDEKIDDGDEWIDDKIDKGNDKVDEKIDDASDWLKRKSGGLLNGDIDKLSDWVRGKKNKGVKKVRDKENEGVDYAKSTVNEANEWLAEKTSDLASWVTKQSDNIETWVNTEVNKIAEWAKAQITKGEKYAQKVAKQLHRKLKALIKKIIRKIERIKDRVRKILVIIQEKEVWS